MKIHGLKLPKLLQELIKKERWTKPTDIKMLALMTGSQFPEDFTFLDIEGMQRESRPFHLIEDRELAQIYSLASSEKLGKPIVDDGILDIDKSVCIAVNWSEETICLDYRRSDHNPIVVASVCKDGCFTKWEVVAYDFESFALKLGFVDFK